jgi:hypothetical protein
VAVSDQRDHRHIDPVSALSWRAIFEGFLLALALTAVGFFLNLPAVGLFAGTAAGSYFASRSAGHHGAAQGAGVAISLLVAVTVFLFVLRGTTPTLPDSINGTSLAWAATVLLLGAAVGLAARR